MWLVIKSNKKSIEILKESIRKNFLQYNFILRKLESMKKMIKKNPIDIRKVSIL